MSFKGASPNFFHEGLKFISYCPVCRSRYEQVEAKILEERDESYLIHLTCRQCGSSVLALVTAGILGVTSIGMITDLSSEEVIKFKETNSIVADEVIEAHQLLSDRGAIKKLRN